MLMQCVPIPWAATLVHVYLDTREMERCASVGVHSCYVTGLYSIHTDVNECLETENACSNFARCANTNGSYMCYCHLGYMGDGINCMGKITNP